MRHLSACPRRPNPHVTPPIKRNAPPGAQAPGGAVASSTVMYSSLLSPSLRRRRRFRRHRHRPPSSRRDPSTQDPRSRSETACSSLSPLPRDSSDQASPGTGRTSLSTGRDYMHTPPSPTVYGQRVDAAAGFLRTYSHCSTRQSRCDAVNVAQKSMHDIPDGSWLGQNRISHAQYCSHVEPASWAGPSAAASMVDPSEPDGGGLHAIPVVNTTSPTIEPHDTLTRKPPDPTMQ